MQNTENFDLKIYEGEDLFNPLVVENANSQAIDNQMKKNENHTVGDATELVSGTVHALTRLTPDTPMLRFTATSRFTAGDTFTVDGVQVSALTVSGEQLPDGAYIIGSEVLAYLKGTLLTFFTSQGTLATARNALKLGGNTPEYYATATAVQQAQDTATAAGNLANEINSNLVELYSRNMIRVPIVEPTVTTTNSKGIITIDVGLKVTSSFDYSHLDTLNFITFVTEWQTYNTAPILNVIYKPSTHTATIFIYDGQAGQFKFGGYLLFGKYALWN